MKWIKFILLSLLLSCGTEVPEDENLLVFDPQQNFFEIVYEVVGVRIASSNTSFTRTTGRFELKFDTTTEITDDVQLPENIEGNARFTFAQFVNTVAPIGPTDGGYEATFLLTNQENDSFDNEENPYNVFDPYGESDNTGQTEIGDEVVDIITYNFDLVVTRKSCFPVADCQDIPTNHSVRLVRFANGTLFMENLATGFEYYLRPKII